MATNIETLLDKDWMNRSFILANEDYKASSGAARWSKFSSADLKYTGTGLGQNNTINSAPAFTPMCDIPRPGLLAAKDFNIALGSQLNYTGMGPRYSEAIDDNKQVVHLRFGIVKYKGLVTFFTSFYDNYAAQLARYGRVGIGYYIGSLAGTLLTLPLAPFILAGDAWEFVMGRQSTRFMDFKPAMPLFYQRVQVIYNGLGANMGIIARTFNNTGHWGNGADSFSDLDQTNETAYTEAMSRIMPEFFEKNGLLDVFKVSTGTARREKLHRNQIDTIAENATGSQDLYNKILDYIDRKPVSKVKPAVSFETYLRSYHESVLGSIKDFNLETSGVEDALSKAIDDVSSGNDPDALNKLQTSSRESGQSQNAVSDSTDTADSAATGVDINANGFLPNSGGGLLGLGTNTLNIPGSSTDNSRKAASSQPTGNNTTHEVDANGNQISPTSETGQVGVTDPSAYDKSKNREGMSVVVENTNADGNSEYHLSKGWFADAAEFFKLETELGSAFINLAVNYTGAGTATFSNSLKDTTLQGLMNGTSGTARDARVSAADFNTGFGFIDETVGFVRGLFGGVMDKVSLQGLMALAGNAFVDIPKQWDNSTATFPTATFSMELRSPYGNDLARYINLYMPIAALLAGALPQSAGPQSYTSPSVCECYCQGLTAIRLGMITDLTITAGAGNLGYNSRRQPLGFDVQFTVADMSSLMHAPIGNGFNPLNPFRRVLDDDNAFTDYMATITGVHMRDMTNSYRKLAIRSAARYMDYKAMLSPAHIASRLAGTDSVMMLNKLLGGSYYPGV